jgi:ubiquinone/menaquinone biosynthesis C-methylase UbiE
MSSFVPDLTGRATDGELLDAELPASEVQKSLADLRLVNRWLSGRGGLLRAVSPHLPPGGRLLDVGCGSGDVAAYLRAGLAQRGLTVGVDLKPLHLREAPPVLRQVAADARRLPFRDKAFDVVTASLFLHHFDEPELPELLRGLARLARRAIVVSDLERALVPFVFARAVFPWLFESRVSVHDGLVSIRRAFREAELRAAFDAAGLGQVRIRRLFPYRLLAVAALP